MLTKNTVLRDQSAAIDAAIDGALGMAWTALPAIVTAYDPEQITIEAQPAIQGRVMRPDGTVNLVNLPLLLDCPVCFPHAGACSLTFPIQIGDECLIVFADRAIDLWWQQGGVQPPAEVRMHDLSDGFCILAPWSQKTKITDLNLSEVELRSDDRRARIALNPKTHDITLQTVGNVIQKIDGNVTQTIGGNVSETVSGSVTADVKGSTTVTCPSITVNASKSVTYNTPIFTVNGLIKGTGGLVVSGGSGGAAASVSGSMKISENVTTGGDVNAGGISLRGHTHGGVRTGGGSTGGPQ